MIRFIFLILIFALTSSSWAQEWKRQILEDASSLYEPIARESFKKSLHINIKQNNLSYASADHDENELRVTINSGLLDSDRLTPDSLRMIVCHELGHLFGGAPRRNVPVEWDGPMAQDGLSLLSSEGQADYYAAVVCFKKFISLPQSPSERPTDITRAGPVFKNKCLSSTSTPLEYNNCLRAGLAAIDFLNLVRDFPISCEKHDSSHAKTLIRDFYPERQCRLDTMINGTLCQRETPFVLNFHNPDLNDCGTHSTKRPACWYPEHD
jgi:hypothetical protein